MTITTDVDAPETDSPEPTSSLRRVLLVILAVAALAIAVAGGFAWGSHSGSSGGAATPSAVDIGFARDMSNHHQQAVEMAAYTRDHSTNVAVRTIAYDIEQNQSLEEGEMTGWLDTWGLTRYNPHPMLWMGAQHAQHVVNGLMPGMATPTQIAKLFTLTGKSLDVLFLQLMIHHHQGGLPMAQFAERNASLDYVRTLAGHMWASQSTQTIQMEQLLRQLGGSPLPPPDV